MAGKKRKEMSRQERGISVLTTLGDIARSPRTLEALVLELRRLNDNLEALRLMSLRLQEMAEAGLDVRQILAHEFGWRIKEQEEKDETKSAG